MVIVQCPTQETLQQYLAGSLDGEQDAWLDSHLETCAQCQTKADSLDKLLTPFPDLPGSPSPHPIETDPMLGKLVSRAKALSPTADLASTPEEAAANLELGPYVLLEQIGAGGMGRVYKALHRPMQRTVAVKLLAPQHLRSGSARFQREAILAGSLIHPHIVTAYDAGEADGRWFLAMELVEGEDLANRVKREGPLSLAFAVDVLRQSAQGLAHAHDAGVIHRDLKPANLLVDADGTVKLSDLGLARLRDVEETGTPNLTSQQTIVGTTAYMAPEQGFDPRNVGPAVDVYALGCTLYYLMTAKVPFQAEMAMETLYAHREHPIPSLGEVRPDCPPALDALFQSMLAKSPTDRPSARAVLDILGHIDVGSSTPTPKRTQWAWLAVAASLLMMSLAVAWWFSRTPPVGSLTAQQFAGVESKPEPKTEVTPPVVPPKKHVPKIEMVSISAGTFRMGSPKEDPWASPDERPRHEVHISTPFMLGKFEITQEQYEQVKGSNPSAFGPKGRFHARAAKFPHGRLPVESLSWMDAVCFCNALSELAGLPPYYDIRDTTVTIRGGTGYRLPTEAEWEYACRAGTTTPWSFGDDMKEADAFAWSADNAQLTTHPVGEKKANGFGLFDMHGNVPEWCWDRYDPEYYRVSPVSDPPGSGKGNTRIYRGGSWNHNLAQARSASRFPMAIGYRSFAGATLVGLRVARNKGEGTQKKG